MPRGRLAEPAARAGDDDDLTSMFCVMAGSLIVQGNDPCAGDGARARTQCRSAAGGRHQLLGIALALDMDLSRRALDLGQIIGAQRDIGRAEVFFQAMQRGGAGYRMIQGFCASSQASAI